MHLLTGECDRQVHSVVTSTSVRLCQCGAVLCPRAHCHSAVGTKVRGRHARSVRQRN